MKYISLFTFLLFIVLLILILLKKKYSRVENFSTQLKIIDLGTELSKPTPIPSTENFKDLVKNYYSDNEDDKSLVVAKYGFITTWDTSQVTDMSSAFYFSYHYIKFNGNFDQDFRKSNDINTKIVKYTDSDGNKNEYIAWNTSEVTNMSNMFNATRVFNGDISNWDTSKVTNMNRMFRLCNNFNQNINTKQVTVNGETYTAWDTKNVTNMSYMFYNATSFSQDVSKWDTSSVTNMGNMFYNASSFNQDISTIFVEDVRVLPNGLFQSYIAWDTKNVTDMNRMFTNNYIFNGNISNWNTSNVTDMEYMFFNAKNFNGNISNWDTSNVRKMRGMFNSAYSFYQNITHWKVTWQNSPPINMFNIYSPVGVSDYISFVTKFRYRNGVEVIDSNGTPTLEFFNQPVPSISSTTPTTTTIPKPTFVYNNITNDIRLCGKEESPNTIIEWKGVDCGNGNIEWQSMKSVDNRINNKTLEQCSWIRQQYDENEGWNDDWLGQCGISPTNVPDLPKEQFVYNYKTKNNFFCGDGENKDTEMEWKGVECDKDGNIQWQSMKSVANRKGEKSLEECSWRRKPYDEDADQNQLNNEWNSKYVGHCGVSPSEEQNLPKNVAELYPTTISTTTTLPPTTSTTTTEDPTTIPTTTTTLPTTSTTTTEDPTTTSTTTSTTLTTPTTTSTTTLPTTSTTTYKDDPMCRFIPNGKSYNGCVAECLSPRNKNFGGDLCTKNICEAKCSECKNSNLCKWLVQSEYSNDKIKLEGIEGNKRVQLYWNLNTITIGDLKEFIVYYKNTYTDNINAGISIKTIPFKQNKKNYSIVIDNLDNSTDYSFVVNLVNKTNNIEYISNTINLIPNSITQLIL